MAVEWPLLAPLSADTRALLLKSTRRRTFHRGEVVFHEGDPADALHLIESGRFTVEVVTSFGDTVILTVESAGQYFGELTALRDGPAIPRTATVTALEPASTLVLSGKAFRDLCDRNPAVLRIVVMMLATRVSELSDRLVEAMYVAADQRVYRRLLDLAGTYTSPDGSQQIPLTQQQLAEMAGATRATVNQILQRLAAAGTVALHRGRIEILDHEALHRRSRLT